MARAASVAAAVLVVAAGSAAPAAAASSPRLVHGARAAAGPDVRRACRATVRPGIMTCFALVRTDRTPRPQASFGRNAPTAYGYGPSQLQSAYRLPSSSAGQGQTVAVVDAYNDPDAASNLATYRKAWGEPACDQATGAGCLTKVNESGAASPLPRGAGSSGWATEESLDVDMVSAICPNCHIVLVEASTPSVKNLGTGVNSAVTLGADFVSNSYGGKQASNDPTLDTDYYQHPGVAVVASAGDSGYGVSYPAASQYVTSAGGTTLRKAPGTTRGWKETAWSGTGSGCATYEAKPAWQTDTGCSQRTDNDVAADANPSTGVAVYDTYDGLGWEEVGGTSASSPIIAATFALAGTPAAGTYPSSYPYADTAGLFDVTSGSDGSCSPSYLCTAGPGYDGPTGWGSPDGTAAFAP